MLNAREIHPNRNRSTKGGMMLDSRMIPLHFRRFPVGKTGFASSQAIVRDCGTARYPFPRNPAGATPARVVFRRVLITVF